MEAIYITLAVEDVLSEAVARKLLMQSDRNYQVSQCLCRGGFGYLKSRINAFNQAARILPFFVLTDQDSGCPPEKIAAWLKQKPSANLIFRTAVMEIESWIMAHREAFAQFISVSQNRVPDNTDEIKRPKEFLLSLARKSRSKRLREDIVPSPGSTAQVGPDYNNRLSQFVCEQWDVRKAAKHSESLSRAFSRIREFRPLWCEKINIPVR